MVCYLIYKCFVSLQMEALPRFFLFWKIFSSIAFGYPSGKISMACNSMLPSHGNAISQTSPPPYAISISNTSFTPGDEITEPEKLGVQVEYYSRSAELQPGTLMNNGICSQQDQTQWEKERQNHSLSKGKHSYFNLVTVYCGKKGNTYGFFFLNTNSSVSHTNRDSKQNVTAVWIAPPGVGQVVFRYGLLYISTEEGCGTQKFCFSSPEGCNPQDPNCYFMSSEALETPAFKFEMSGLSDGYIGIGFSDDTIMLTCRILKHTRRPFITDQKVNISSFQTLGGTSSTPLIIKAHGALMLIAWMTTGSVGMIFARYLKKSIKRTLLGKDIWFQIHSLFMLLSVVATSIAFILIFVAVKGWSDNAGAHAVIGCIVMVLSFFQPVIAFLRPSLKNNWRFVFNWFHMLNALVIKVLAVAAIFLGLQMLSNTSSQWMVKTMGGFVGWEALLAIMLDVNLWLKKKEIYEDPQPKSR
ncbi:hypothetical protein JD844_017532 [Phrynosoma platyrhinos]|uniref:Cytochrome b561 domain-containing protein n=1 Tax=Phrynosoma platyrhinos TaxID=52577 RepID=A0ABQ7SM20_PHRPL|nr:hypothetical protein JD844_017532 [Phrynosoma platyrhinos]